MRHAHRARVEHVFAVEKRRMGLVVRTIGQLRATAKITLANLAYIYGHRVIAVGVRVADSAAIRALGPVVFTIGGCSMTHYVGLDVSQKVIAVCIVDDAGRRVWRGQCTSDPEQIERVVRQHAEDARVGIETGPMTPWLVHELRGRGLEVTCLDARHARAALKMQINKTDQNDAEGLAHIMRTGWYRSVHVKSFDSHRARALLGARVQLVGMTTRLDTSNNRRWIC